MTQCLKNEPALPTGRKFRQLLGFLGRKTIFSCGCDEIALRVPGEQDLAAVVAVETYFEQPTHSLGLFQTIFIYIIGLKGRGRRAGIKVEVSK